jgi:hypothetical protein
MPKIPQDNSASLKDERTQLNLTIKDLIGVFTQAARVAIPDQYLYNIENAIPIGSQNLRTVPNVSQMLYDYGADEIYYSLGVNLGGAEYLVNISIGGNVYLWGPLVPQIPGTAVVGENVLLGAGLATYPSVAAAQAAGGAQAVQWKNTTILIIDSTGYYAYEANPAENPGSTAGFTQVGGGAASPAGVPIAGDAIAVYAGRVWIAVNRTIFFSAVDTDTSAGYIAANWLDAAGGGFVILTDPTIRSKVYRLIATNAYLYIFSDGGIDAISDVYVPSTTTVGAAPEPTFTLQNLQGLIGSRWPMSVCPYDRNVLFASTYGFHTLIGVDAPKMSSDIDGTWQYVDPTVAISAGQVVIRNMLCGAFLIKRLNDPVFGSNPIIACWYNQSQTNQLGISESTDIWFFANFGDISLIVTGFVESQPALFCFINNQLFQLFADDTTGPHVEVWTKLYSMEDELAKKQVIQCGTEADYYIFGSNYELYVDIPQSSFDSGLNFAAAIPPDLEVTPPATSTALGPMPRPGAVIPPGHVVGPGAYLPPAQNAPTTFLVRVGGQAPGLDRNVGLRLVTDGFSYELHFLAMDYKMLDRWAP